MNQPLLPALRSNLQFTVHRQGKEFWYAVQDNVSGRFSRLGRKEYLIASSLDGKRDASAVVEAVQKIAPEEKLTPRDVLGVVDWLMKHGLLEAGASGQPNPPPAPNRPAGGLNPLYIRLPLIPGRKLEKLADWLQPVVSRPAIGAVGLLSIIAVLSVISRWSEFRGLAGKLFVEDGRIWWVIAWLVLKAVHELGHAIVAVKVGSQIRSGGISLICLAPVPYIDISDLWTISNRWHRIACCAAGMLVELGVAAVAAIVALYTENQTLQYFCCALATLGTVTTLAFNANPLIRFDGYFIVSDLWNRPNLWTEGNLALHQFVRKILDPRRPATQKMTPVLIAYGLLCFQYRIVLLVSLALWAVFVWEGLGVLLVVWGLYSVLFMPWLRNRAQRVAEQKMSSSSSSEQASPSSPDNSAWRWSLVAGVVAALLLAPSPVQPQAPGVVSLREPLTVRTQTEGRLVQVYVQASQWVREDELLAVLDNPQLEFELASKQTEVSSAEGIIQSYRAAGNLAALQAQQAKLNSLRDQLSQLETKVEQLEIRATHSGVVVHSDLHRQLGRYFPVGDPLCVLAQEEGLEIKASVDQRDVASMRHQLGKSVAIRLATGHAITGVLEKVEPRGSRRLDEPVLAAIYGGPLPVALEDDSSDEDSLQLVEPRFQIHVQLSRDKQQDLVPGQLASIRIPGKTNNLWQGLGRWLEKKWKGLKQDAQRGVSSG